VAQPTNAFDTYAAKGVREDLSDKIYQVSPEKTPVLSMGQRLKAKQKFTEWQRDALATPNKDNAAIEGNTVTAAALTATDRVGNYCQLFDKTITVTSTLRKSTAAGRSDDMKYQIANKGIPEIKRDIEAMLTSNNAAVAGVSSTARKSGGLGVMIYTNALHNGAGATATHNSGAPTVAVTAGTNRAFTEALTKTLLASIYTNSGDQPDFISVTPTHKQTFSGFAGIAVNRYQVPKGQQGVIVGGADVYVGDFGELTVVPNYVQATSNATTALILNKEQYGVAWLQNIDSVALAKVGHSDNEMVYAECAAVALAEKSLGKIADLS
jgi:hypothetical protein